MHLRLFKEGGKVKHEKTLLIPSTERIPALTRSDEGYNQVYMILVANLQQAFSNLNLRKGFNEDQLLELAELIIESASEDNLSLEDVLLFLQELVLGKAGKIFDRLDIPTFFELFEGYREQRYLALRYIQYEANANYKAAGDPARLSDGREDNDTHTQEIISRLYKTTIENAQDQPVQPPITPGGQTT